MTIFGNLLSRDLIESVERDDATATKWLEDAGRHLDAAQKIIDLDPSGAYVLAYDAARKSVAAALLITGHRVRNRPGAHQALIQYSAHLATQTGESALKRFDRLRRNRNRSELRIEDLRQNGGGGGHRHRPGDPSPPARSFSSATGSSGRPVNSNVGA